MSGHRQSNAPKPPPGEWANRANCLGLDAELFFPERGDPEHVTQQAKAVCRGCSVIHECASYAMTPPVITNGTWGGLSAKERGRILRQRRREQEHEPYPHGTRSRYNALGCRCDECRKANAAYGRRLRGAS